MSRVKTPRQTRLVPRVKVWLELDGRYAFGFGISEILLAVDRTGSIKQAAADLGKSYRHIWGRIKKAESTLGRQLVITQVGGKDSQRSCLTIEAKRLAADFQTVRLRMIQAVKAEFARFPAWSPVRQNVPRP